HRQLRTKGREEAASWKNSMSSPGAPGRRDSGSPSTPRTRGNPDDHGRSPIRGELQTKGLELEEEGGGTGQQHGFHHPGVLDDSSGDRPGTGWAHSRTGRYQHGGAAYAHSFVIVGDHRNA